MKKHHGIAQSISQHKSTVGRLQCKQLSHKPEYCSLNSVTASNRFVSIIRRNQGYGCSTTHNEKHIRYSVWKYPRRSFRFKENYPSRFMGLSQTMGVITNGFPFTFKPVRHFFLTKSRRIRKVPRYSRAVIAIFER